MSSIEYRGLLCKVSQGINWLNDGGKLLSLCEGLIGAGSENNIQNVASLFKELERQNNLGIDHLDVLKALLRGIWKWSLSDEVERLQVRRETYVSLREKIVLKLGEHDVRRLIEICGEHLAVDTEGHINDVRTLFKELENKNRLGADCLKILKKILKETEEEELLKEVEDFERKRKDEEITDRQRIESEMRRARALAVLSSAQTAGRAGTNFLGTQAAAVWSYAKNAGEKLLGTVTSWCTFRNVAGGVVAVTTWMILKRSSNLGEFVKTFKNAVLPLGNTLRAIGEGSACFTIQAENRSALEALWERYQNGTLQKDLQEFLVTEEIKQLANSEEVMVTVEIDEQEYKKAFLELTVAEIQVPYNERDDQLVERNRRNSDSVLYVKEKDNDTTVVLSKLKQAEIEFQQEKILSLERNIVEYQANVEELEKKIESGTGYEEFDPECLPENASGVSSETTGIWSQSAPSVVGIENLEGYDDTTSGALPIFSLTKETTNFARLCVLLIDVATQALRDAFNAIHAPENLHTVLARNKITLQSLRSRKIINSTQWEKLFPAIPTSVSSTNFDRSLLIVLLRNICGLNIPPHGWKRLTAARDVTSLEVEIARLRYFRYTVYAQAEHASVDDVTFNKYWKDIRDTLVRLGGVKYRAAIDNLETECMNPEIEDRYKERLRKDDEDKRRITDEIGDIGRQVEHHFKERLEKIEENKYRIKNELQDIERQLEKVRTQLEVGSSEN